MKLGRRLLPIALVMALLLGARGVYQPQPADAQVFLAPTITKSFSPASMVLGQATVLTIIVTNPNAFVINNVAYTDSLPTGLTAGGSFSVFSGGGCTPTAPYGLAGNTATVTYASIAANTSCGVIIGNITAAAAGTYVNTTSAVTVTGGPTGNPATATLNVTAAPTPVPSTPVPTATPTQTPVPPPVVIPQVIQNPARGGIFNGTRNDTPTPVRPATVAGGSGGPGGPGGPAPVLRPPSTGESGLADNGTSNVVYGLALIAALGVVTFGAARLRTVRNR